MLLFIMLNAFCLKAQQPRCYMLEWLIIKADVITLLLLI